MKVKSMYAQAIEDAVRELKKIYALKRIVIPSFTSTNKWYCAKEYHLCTKMQYMREHTNVLPK